MGTKRPSTDVEDIDSPPHKLIKSNPKESDCSDCPICLESCHVTDQCFALDCCNRSLADDSPRQMCHKTCFFSAGRHTLESAVKNGERLMWMTDERLRSILRCPRCRADLPLRRSLSIEKQSLVIQYEWTDGTPIAQATHAYLQDNTISDEKALFYATIVGPVDDPASVLHSTRVKGLTVYVLPHRIHGVLSEPVKANVTITNPRRQLLGVVVPQIDSH